MNYLPSRKTGNASGLNVLWRRDWRKYIRSAGTKADSLLGQWHVGMQWCEGQAAEHLKILKMGA